MRKALLCISLFIAAIGQAQVNAVFLRGKTIEPSPNFGQLVADDTYLEGVAVGGYIYRLVQFGQMPDAASLASLEGMGVRVLDYIPQNTFLCGLPEGLRFSTLSGIGIRSIFELDTHTQRDQNLYERPFPAHAYVNHKVGLQLSYYSNLSKTTVETELEKLGQFDFWVNDRLKTVEIWLNEEDIERVISSPIVQFASLVPAQDKPESIVGQGIHRANKSVIPFDGTGVKVAVYDDGFVGPHIDFKGRTEQSSVSGDLIGTHGDGVAGIIGSAGNLNPANEGMAKGVFMHVYQYGNSGNTVNADTIYQNRQTTIFNASYSNGCNAGYTNTTREVDLNCLSFPEIIMVYSAGNDGDLDCGFGAGTDWGNITGGHKIGKNVIAVANLDQNEQLEASSSRGPSRDGRIKPDLAAHGNGHVSNSNDNTYQTFSGTSAAAPGVAGVAAQLTEAYKALNGGGNPPAALIKSILLNTADDLGNKGPDFKFGWGRVNARKSLSILTQNHIFRGNIGQNGSQSHTINVPPGMATLKVMLYWADPAGSVLAGNTLVNNLELRVEDPQTTTHLPWLLNHLPDPATLNAPAIRGTDNRNNVEQVEISNPSPGMYQLNISGASVIPAGQEYFLVYYFEENNVAVTYPNGDEALQPGGVVKICWDAPISTNPFRIDFSTDAGQTWSNIANNISANARQHNWTIPNVITDRAMVKIYAGAMVDSSDMVFDIIGVSGTLRMDSVCRPFVYLSWDSVAHATSYDLMVLGTTYMDSVLNTNSRNVVWQVPNWGGDVWVSVRARRDSTIVGERRQAIKLNLPSCVLFCNSYQDVGVQSIVAPIGNTLNCDVNPIPVTVQLSSLSDSLQTNFQVHYRVNNGLVVSELVQDTIFPRQSISYQFSQQIPASLGNGNHDLHVWTSKTGDITTCNDTLSGEFITGQVLASPYSQNFNGSLFPPPSWYILNPDARTTWTSRAVVGPNNQTSNAAFIDLFNYSTTRQKDYLYTTTIDVSGLTTPNIAFDVSHKRFVNGFNDSLGVEISQDCGNTFHTIYSKGSLDLATVAGIQGMSWEPTSSTHWRRESISLDTFPGSDFLIVRFVTTNASGNNVYIENVNILESPTSVQQNSENEILDIWPNPTHGEVAIQYRSDYTGEMVIELLDIHGRILEQIRTSKASDTFNYQLNMQHLTNGMYFVKLAIGESVISSKIALSK